MNEKIKIENDIGQVKRAVGILDEYIQHKGLIITIMKDPEILMSVKAVWWLVNEHK